MAKKKQTKQVRISAQFYEAVRRAAFRRHVPMTTVLQECIKKTLYRKV